MFGLSLKPQDSLILNYNKVTARLQLQKTNNYRFAAQNKSIVTEKELT